ncbi:MAG: hypothetical protein EPN72_05150 [Nevskiaceae bacterium]|nr:MAG: hypothetical protein EPN63_04045 [Nevskiaceae bacterium]TBR73529.1 MAG: hypothetical protein EPN72_05150 [Nevskiaceae bacterium]
MPDLPEQNLWGQAHRCAILDGNAHAVMAVQEFSDLRRYVRMMEQLINEAERTEVENLRPEVVTLNTVDRNEFWMQYYPTHWDDVVREAFRASTVIALVSFLETTLSRIARDVSVVVEEALSASDFGGSVVQRSKKYLIRFGGFQTDENGWAEMDEIIQIRNALAHANGNIDQCKNSNRIRKIIEKGPGLRDACGRISIDTSYLEHCLESVQIFLLSLSNDMRGLCNRITQLEDR